MSAGRRGAASPASGRPVGPGRHTRLAGLLALAALAGCGGLRTMLAPPPEARPGEKAGWLAYRVGNLHFEAPAGWAASGDPSQVALEADGLKLEVRVVDGRFSPKSCLAEADAALQRGADQLTRVQRHTSSLAGRGAVVQEADAGGWHGWAYGLCDGPVQYRLFFTGRSPIPAEVLEAWRGVVASARLGGVS